MSDIERREPKTEPTDPGKTTGIDEYFEGTTLSTEKVTFQREGLPADYRMRHDEHYVDELVAAGSMPPLRLVPTSEIEGATASTESLVGLVDSIQAYGVLQPLLVRGRHGRYELLAGSKRLTAALDAGLKEVPCLVHEVDDVEARRLAEAANHRISHPQPARVAELPLGASANSLLGASLQAIVSSLSLLEQPDRPLRDHVAVALIRAEAMKSERLLRGLQLLAADPPLARQSLDATQILKSVLEHSEDERSLLGIELESSMPASCEMRADEGLIRVAFAGAVETILSLLRTSRGAKLTVHLSHDQLTRNVTLLIAEDPVRMPAATWSRWFDLNWQERPGGYGAAIGLLAAKRTAELHDGRLELAPTRAGGCQLAMRLPTTS